MVAQLRRGRDAGVASRLPRVGERALGAGRAGPRHPVGPDSADVRDRQEPHRAVAAGDLEGLLDGDPRATRSARAADDAGERRPDIGARAGDLECVVRSHGGPHDVAWGLRQGGGLEQVLERRLDAARDDDHRAGRLAHHAAGHAAEQHGAARAVAARPEHEQIGVLGLPDEVADRVAEHDGGLHVHVAGNSCDHLVEAGPSAGSGLMGGELGARPGDDRGRPGPLDVEDLDDAQLGADRAGDRRPPRRGRRWPRRTGPSRRRSVRSTCHGRSRGARPRRGRAIRGAAAPRSCRRRPGRPRRDGSSRSRRAPRAPVRPGCAAPSTATGRRSCGS